VVMSNLLDELASKRTTPRQAAITMSFRSLRPDSPPHFISTLAVSRVATRRADECLPWWLPSAYSADPISWSCMPAVERRPHDDEHPYGWRAASLSNASMRPPYQAENIRNDRRRPHAFPFFLRSETPAYQFLLAAILQTHISRLRR
jgi:hypothetical protein